MTMNTTSNTPATGLCDKTLLLFPGPLPEEEEARLAARAKGGDEDAAEALCLANMRSQIIFGRHIASGGKLTDGELVSLCYEALRRSIRTFQAGIARFSTYARSYTRGLVLSTLTRNKTVVRHGVTVTTALNPEDGEEVEDYCWFGPPSLPNFDALDAAVVSEELHKHVLERLTDAERVVIKLHYDGHETFDAIARRLKGSPSRQYVCKLHQSALNKLRRAFKIPAPGKN